MTNSKLGAGQVVILLFLSRAFNVLNYVPIFNKKAEGIALLYGSLLGFIASIIILIPPLLLYKKFEGENFLDVLYKKAKPIGIIISILIFLLIFLTLIGTIVSFEFFMTNAVYPDASVGVIAITMCISCFAASLNGLEGLARASLIIFVFFLIGSLFISVASIPSIKMLNLKPVLNEPVKSAVIYAMDLVAKSHELYLFILLLPRIKGNVNKAAFWFLTLTFSFVALTNFLIMGVLGDFYKTQTFPYYSLASVIEVSVLQRLDSIHMISWVFISFIRITTLIILSRNLLGSLIPKKARKLGLPIMFVTATTASVFLSYQTAILDKLNTKVPIFMVVFLFLLPLIMLLTCKKKGGKNSGENKSKVKEEAFTILPDSN